MMENLKSLPDSMEFDTAGQMCRYIENNPEILLMYELVEEDKDAAQKQRNKEEKKQ